ncbi:MAG: lysostaphin resistance A-like protein [Candidatus Acidiferrales bacterium]
MSSESSPAPARRLISFLRSVLPAEPAQWLLLAGATFLFISPELRWWPGPSSTLLAEAQFLPFPGLPFIMWAKLARLLSLPILAAGAIGYFACFRRVLKNPRNTLLLILACALTGLLAVCGVALLSYRGDVGGAPSVFSSYRSHGSVGLHELGKFFVDLGPGLRFASAGFLLVAIFTWLVWTGRATLPIRLPSTLAQETSEGVLDDEPRDVAVFVPAMIGLMPLLGMAQGLVWLPVILWPPHLLFEARPALVIVLRAIVDALFLGVFVLLAMGKERREVFPGCLRWPRVKYIALAVVLTAAIFQVWPLISYLKDRNAWAHLDWVFTYAPRFLSYFALPQPQTFWRLVPAMAEEIAWRGYLQPRFIRRYGLWRGIFLVGLAWGAFHFSWDFGYRTSDGQVFILIARRLAGTVGHSYLLAWLTIRSESILPSTISHGVYNMFAYAGLPVRTPSWYLVPLWALLGYVLFHFWPPASPSEGASPDPLPETSAAT